MYSSEETAEYAGWCGITRRKKEDMNVMPKVPTASIRRKLDVLSGNATVEMDEKKKALSPKAERGNAVAVPR